MGRGVYPRDIPATRTLLFSPPTCCTIIPTADVLISLHFVAGVTVFLLAHQAYIAAFLQDSHKPFLWRAVMAHGYGAVVLFYLTSASNLRREAV
ncbi:MAG: hypothetical protein JSV68_21020 [Anaerolineaceae bacterium]|nr:MAG: hypothetical protein JSV68_21020 [Anaerolineaceae bacterium]